MLTSCPAIQIVDEMIELVENLRSDDELQDFTTPEEETQIAVGDGNINEPIAVAKTGAPPQTNSAIERPTVATGLPQPCSTPSPHRTRNARVLSTPSSARVLRNNVPAPTPVGTNTVDMGAGGDDPAGLRPAAEEPVKGPFGIKLPRDWPKRRRPAAQKEDGRYIWTLEALHNHVVENATGNMDCYWQPNNCFFLIIEMACDFNKQIYLFAKWPNDKARKEAGLRKKSRKARYSEHKEQNHDEIVPLLAPPDDLEDMHMVVIDRFCLSQVKVLREELEAYPKIDAFVIPTIADTLQLLVDWCQHHKDIPPREITKPIRSVKMAKVVTDMWDAPFIDISKKRTFNLILLANMLQCTPLVHLACAKVATLIKGKSPEEIKDVLRNEDDN